MTWAAAWLWPLVATGTTCGSEPLEELLERSQQVFLGTTDRVVLEPHPDHGAEYWQAFVRVEDAFKGVERGQELRLALWSPHTLPPQPGSQVLWFARDGKVDFCSSLHVVDDVGPPPLDAHLPQVGSVSDQPMWNPGQQALWTLRAARAD